MHVGRDARIDGVLATTHAVGSHQVEHISLGARGVHQGEIGTEGGEEAATDGEADGVTIWEVAKHRQVRDERRAIEGEVLRAGDIAKASLIGLAVRASTP